MIIIFQKIVIDEKLIWNFICMQCECEIFIRSSGFN